MPSSERRVDPRWNLRPPLRVFVEGSEVALGHAVDISRKGLQLMSSEPIPLERSFRLILEIIVRDVNDKIPMKTKVPLQALSVWSERDGPSQFYTGFHIFDISSASADSVRRLIEQIKSPGGA